jgi:DNA mismatch repair protein MutL
VSHRIKVLSEAVSNRIAAGEVIEGPFSVVKELIENALDAGADSIAIDVKGGGGDLVRVSDNGSGMGREDAVAAFDRFATSKLESESDLEAIASLGFRGEALPSIASVSRMRLVTSEPGSSDGGTEVSLVAGTLRDVRPAARAPGTTVEVSSLFFNTPARRKFLRSDRVELRRILDLIGEYAVAYTGVRFDVEVDGRPVLELLPTTDLSERVAGILGSAIAKDMLPVSAEDGPYAVEGLVGRPSIARPRAPEQLTAVNGRPVRSRLLAAAIRSGYGELLPRDRHPVVFLLIRVAGTALDVNVHPTKREVRFGDSRAIFSLVERAVRGALITVEAAPTLGSAWGDRQARADGAGSSLTADPQELPFVAAETDGGWAGARGEKPAGGPGGRGEEIPREAAEGPQDAKFWQLHGQYVFVQTREGVLVIDQHAAHERILYEEALHRLSGTVESGPSQQLLFPVVVELSPGEWQSYEDAHPLLEKLGFATRPLSGRTVLLEAVPGGFPRWPHDRVVHDILAELPRGTTALRDIIESIARTMACKTAIKAGDPMRPDEMRALVDQLFATELPHACPHGRPTFMRITLAEFDKRFGRT